MLPDVRRCQCLPARRIQSGRSRCAWATWLHGRDRVVAAVCVGFGRLDRAQTERLEPFGKRRVGAPDLDLHAAVGSDLGCGTQRTHHGGIHHNARPQLEIHADDVKCAHGAAVGSLDEEALFYLRQRGLDPHAARALLTEAFAAEIVADVPVAMREGVLRAVRRWLERT